MTGLLNNLSGFNAKSLMINDTFSTMIKSKGQEVIRNSSKGDIVDIYRNLNKLDFFSIRQTQNELKGKVSGYSNIVLMENPVIKISLASRKRVLSTNRKNVHCVLRGTLLNAYSGDFICTDEYTPITYNPYLMETFFHRETNQPVLQSEMKKYAIFHGANVYLTDHLNTKK